MDSVIGWLVTIFFLPHVLDEVGKPFASAMSILGECFLFVLLLSIAAFFLLERNRLSIVRRWLGLTFLLAHIVLFMIVAIIFICIFANFNLGNALAAIAFYAIPAAASLTLYLYARRRLAHSSSRLRFVLMPLATIFLGCAGVWVSLTFTFGALQVSGP